MISDDEDDCKDDNKENKDENKPPAKFDLDLSAEAIEKRLVNKTNGCLTIKSDEIEKVRVYNR